jgi:signal transduction histidine kinase
LLSLARSAVTSAQRQYPDRAFHLSSQGDSWLLGDADRLGQVLGNLLDNAARHSPPGEPITVSVVGTEERVTLVVSDRGTGIPPQHLPHLFDRFYRAGGTDNDGLGLGLAIVKHLCEAHGGTISVASTVGEGSCFTVSLPSSPSNLHY